MYNPPKNERIRQLEDRRAQVTNAYRDIYKLAADAGREMSGDEKRRAEEVWNELRGLDVEIEHERQNLLSPVPYDERLKLKRAAVMSGSPDFASRAAAREQSDELRAFVTRNSSVNEIGISLPTGEYSARDFARAVGAGDESRANEWYISQNAAAPHSAFLYPAVLGGIVDHLNTASGVMQAGPTILVTDHMKPYNLPVMVTDATVTQKDEGADADQAYVDLEERVFAAYSQRGYFIVSREALGSDAQLEAILGNYAGRAIADKIAALVAVGAGTTTVQGICTSATNTGVTTASSSSITFDEYIRLFTSVTAPYRMRGSFILSDGAYNDLLLSTNENGDYYLRPNEPLLGRPVFVDSNFPANTAGLYTAVFGDISTYIVRFAALDGAQFLFEREDGLGRKGLNTYFVFACWIDAQLGDKTGIAALKMKT